MSLIHKHIFKEAKTRPGVLFCECGKIKKLPCQHRLKEVESILSGVRRDSTGKVLNYDNKIVILECEHCGERDKFFV